MMPPRLVPWPPMYLVREWMTTSAPCSIGRHRAGVATVLSTTSGTPAAWAMAAMAARSGTWPPGLPMVSQKTILVLPSMAARSAFRSS